MRIFKKAVNDAEESHDSDLTVVPKPTAMTKQVGLQRGVRADIGGLQAESQRRAVKKIELVCQEDLVAG